MMMSRLLRTLTVKSEVFLIEDYLAFLAPVRYATTASCTAHAKHRQTTSRSCLNCLPLQNEAKRIHPSWQAFAMAVCHARPPKSRVPTGVLFATMYGWPRGLKYTATKS